MKTHWLPSIRPAIRAGFYLGIVRVPFYCQEHHDEFMSPWWLKNAQPGGCFPSHDFNGFFIPSGFHDHIAIAAKSPFFNRKCIDSIRGPHVPTSYVRWSRSVSQIRFLSSKSIKKKQGLAVVGWHCEWSAKTPTKKRKTPEFCGSLASFWSCLFPLKGWLVVLFLFGEFSGGEKVIQCEKCHYSFFGLKFFGITWTFKNLQTNYLESPNISNYLWKWKSIFGKMCRIFDDLCWIFMWLFT